MRTVLLVTAALLAVHCDEAQSGVTELTVDSWTSTVPSSNFVWAVKFHSEMCKHPLRACPLRAVCGAAEPVTCRS